jgi:hypothetical protein
MTLFSRVYAKSVKEVQKWEFGATLMDLDVQTHRVLQNLRSIIGRNVIRLVFIKEKKLRKIYV